VLFIPISNQPCNVLFAMEPLADPEPSDTEILENWARLPETQKPNRVTFVSQASTPSCS